LPASALSPRDHGDRASPRVVQLDLAPASRGAAFVGHAAPLWSLFHHLVSLRACHAQRIVAVVGAGGSGKSQLAAEFVARHASRGFEGGVVWTTAEGGDATLASQWRGIIAAFAPDWVDPTRPDDDPATQRSALARELVRVFLERAPSGELLWVVDSLPEPEGGRTGGLQHWCPLLGRVSVPVTTRRASLEGAHGHVRLHGLGDAAAFMLLTRPPVDRAWLADDDWRTLVRRVGALPLAITVMHASLADGFDSVRQLLAKAKSEEPSALLDRAMDALRGEVADPLLRGVAESFEALGGGSPVQRNCQIVALLEPVPLAESLPLRLIDSSSIGKLARWEMHRVQASFVRVHGDDIDVAFAQLFDRLHDIDVTKLSGDEMRGMDWQLLHLTRQLRAHLERTQQWSGHAAIWATSFAVEACTASLGHADSRGWRAAAAQLAALLGASDTVTQRLAAAYEGGSEEVVSSIPHTLEALAGPNGSTISEKA
jgi:hypothetical protein